MGLIWKHPCARYARPAQLVAHVSNCRSRVEPPFNALHRCQCHEPPVCFHYDHHAITANRPVQSIRRIYSPFTSARSRACSTAHWRSLVLRIHQWQSSRGWWGDRCPHKNITSRWCMIHHTESKLGVIVNRPTVQRRSLSHLIDISDLEMYVVEGKWHHVIQKKKQTPNYI